MEKLVFDNDSQILAKIEKVRKGFNSKKTLDIGFRKTQLNILLTAVKKYHAKHESSKKIDLGWSEWITYYASYTGVVQDLEYIISNFESWTKIIKVNTSMAFFPASSYLFPEPFGVSLVFSAWNSQFLTLIMPIAASISAGNVCIAKPSELSPATALICEQILSELDPEIVQVVQGDYKVIHIYNH